MRWTREPEVSTASIGWAATRARKLEGQPESNSARVVVRKGLSLRPGHGGLFVPEVGLDVLGKSVAGGTVLARVRSPYTFDELHVLRAPFARTEVMMVRDRVSRVHPGEYAGRPDSGYLCNARGHATSARAGWPSRAGMPPCRHGVRWRVCPK
jgi:hypothetical protein